MSRNRRRAVTLIELTVAMFVASLLLIVIYQLFNNFGRWSERPRAMIGMEESSLKVVRRLERDLAETNLQSIRSVPSVSSPGTRPGLIMESARDDQDHLGMTALGTVQWRKFIYYQLDGSRLGYDDTTTGVAVEPGAPPSLTLAPSPHHRVLAANLVAGGPGTHDGFYAYWVDAHGNKHDFEDSPTARGEPVVVEMALADVSQHTGKQTLRLLKIQVKPQN